MKTVINEYDFDFFEIKEESKQNFPHKTSRDLGDVDAWALKTIGDAIRPDGSQHFWDDGCYSWYTDDNQDHEQSVYVTKENGIICFEDITENKLYRVII